ncbi:biotin lipoate a b protein ligase protein [Apiospora arundinis]
MAISQVTKPFEAKKARVAKLASRLALTDRLRHIWLADAPPHYPSVYVASRVEKLLKGQILEVRKKRKVAKTLPATNASLNVGSEPKLPKTIQQLLERSLLPPAVIAFTPRPTYFLPKQSPLDEAVRKGGVLSRLRLEFPRLPAEGLTMADEFAIATSPKDKENGSATKRKYTTLASSNTAPADPYDHVYETEVHAPLDSRMPPFSGPGRLMLWTVADMEQPRSIRLPFQGRGRREDEGYGGEDTPPPNDIYLWARILAETTINILDSQFGIKAWADPTYSGLWVRRRKGRDDVDGKDRQIAAIWPHVDKASAIVTAGMMLNVGSPKETQLLTEEENPSLSSSTSSSGQAATRNENNKTADDISLNSDDDTTSIATELVARPMGYNPKHRLRRADLVQIGKTMPVRQIGVPSSGSGPGGPVWYTRTVEKHDRPGLASVETCAPLGMDNYAFSVAWSHELTRVLGLLNPHVDHYRDGGWTTLEVADEPRAGSWASRGGGGDGGDGEKHLTRRLPVRARVYNTRTGDEDNYHQEDEEGGFKSDDNGMASVEKGLLEPNFQRTMSRLLRDLSQSVGGKRLDTRNTEDYRKEQRTVRK